MSRENRPTVGGDLFRVLFNAVPLPLFRVNGEIEILDLNVAAQKLYHCSPSQALRKKGGDLLHCINALGSPAGCGQVAACSNCQIRTLVRQVLEGGREVARHRLIVETLADGKTASLDLLLSATPVDFAGEASVLLCLEDISELQSLRALIPICASCKKVRNDQQLWSSVESYFARYHGVDFTHGICPECARRLYPDFYSKANVDGT